MEHQRLVGLVQQYVEQVSPATKKEWKWFGCRSLTLEQAIDRSCRSQVALPDGRTIKHSHQRRIPPGKLEKARRNLSAVSSVIDQADDFEEVFKVTQANIGSISGIGPLAIYDLTLRISEYKGLTPAKVYLHAGALKGARALLAKNRLPKIMDKSCFPVPVQTLEAREIENFLCMYKDHFSNAAIRDTPKVCAKGILCRQPYCCMDTK